MPTDSNTVTTTYIKTNLRHIHTPIVSRHLASRGNNKILRAPPPHISISEDILYRITRRTLVQLITNKYSFLKPYFHKVYAKTHSSPLYTSVTSTCTTHIISSTAPTYAPHCHHWICGQAPLGWWRCWPDGEISWVVDQKQDNRTPPTNKGKGSG